MAKINDIKLSKARDDGKSEIIVRLYVKKQFCPQFRSGLFIDPQRFMQPERGTHSRCTSYVIDIPRKGKLNFAEVKELSEVDTKLTLYLKRIIRICDVTNERHREELTPDWINTAMRLVNKDNTNTEDINYAYIVSLIEKERQEIEAENLKTRKRSFFDYMTDFRDNAKKKVNGRREGERSDNWKRNFDVLTRALKRYEMFVRLSSRKEFTLDVDTIDKETIEDIESFLRNEYALAEEYPEIYKKIPVSTDKRRSPKPQQRGRNAIATLFHKFKAFFNWLNETGITTNNPFIGFEGTTTEKYGTPVYISLEERNQIADFDLSAHPQLAIQRDIFIFQCLIGCRVSDLMRLTPNNVINGAIEYIPRKTKDERQDVVRVPLNDRALALIEKYKGIDVKGRLFPFISPQRYNDAIKEIFRLCGITRLVTVLDSVTEEEVQRPINEVAASHMARKTFIGNLYKRVKDPSLIGSMSGHVEGSRAFARYREIDDDLKREVVSLIE